MGCGLSSSGGDGSDMKMSKTGFKRKLLSLVRSQEDPSHSATVSMKAAILIQNWYRRYRARLEARRMCTWMIYQSLEYSGEQDQLKLYNFFNDMLLLTDKASNHGDGKMFTDAFSKTKFNQASLEDEDVELYELTEYDSIKIESAYKGPRLKYPMTTSQIHNLIKSFKSCAWLHARYLLELLHETRKVLKTKPNLGDASTSISKKITICGDLHGSLEDLLIIFYKNGLPDVTNPYIFNGDFVDRGDNSIEVAIILFSCFLVNSNVFFINRGNHEDHVMNYRYGFIKEIQAKYPHHANKVVRLFCDVFSWLPLGTIVDKKIMVCHGGISDKTDLTVIANIDRHKYLSTLRPPVDCDGDNIDYKEWRQVLDILWSDPKSQNGSRPNTFRGGGSYFGPDITESILRKHDLDLLIRSHECKIDGYEYTHNDLVLTVFSASNYYEDGSNRGAILRLDNEHRINFVQYVASKKAGNSSMTMKQKVSQIEECAIADLRAKLLASKLELSEGFMKYDPNNTGVIKLSEWCGVLDAVMEMNLPWRTLRPKLVELDKNEKNVRYMTTFDKIAVTNKLSTVEDSITEQLYKNRDSLETIFRIIDKDNSGCISLDEFKEAYHVLDKHTHRATSEEAIENMAKSLDINKDGLIDFNEFLEAFRIVDSNMKSR